MRASVWGSLQKEIMKLGCLVACSQLKEKKMKKASILSF